MNLGLLRIKDIMFSVHHRLVRKAASATRRCGDERKIMFSSGHGRRRLRKIVPLAGCKREESIKSYIPTIRPAAAFV
jgi:hypothetical protein